MAKLESVVGEPGQISVERVPMLPKPMAHKDECGYVAHQLACASPDDKGLCACDSECNCGSMTEREIHNWLDVLRPSRAAIAAAAAANRGGSGGGRKKDMDADF